MKVLLVGPLPPPYGGIPKYVKDLSGAKIDGVDFVVFNTAIPNWVSPTNREGKMSYASVLEGGGIVGLKRILFVLLSFPILFIEIVREKPDIVQVFTCSYWGYWRNWLYVLIAKILKKKTISHLLNAIDIFYEGSSRIGKWCIEFSLRSADVYIVQSPLLSAWLKGYSPKKVFGVWNGIDIDNIPINKESFPRTSNKEPITGITVGKLGKNKGTYLILDVLSELKAEGFFLKWIFIGNGDIEDFQKITNEKGLADRVNFTGPVDDLARWHLLYTSDFFCLPSYAEGQPISLIEAMAIGLPVISTTVGSIPEMVEDHQSGLIVKPGDCKELKQAIYEISDPSRRITMGKRAREIALQRHNCSDLFTILLGIYKELIIAH